MKKLSLNLEQLSVESFETDEGGGSRPGTVRAYACSNVCTASCDPTCGNVPESYDSACAIGATNNCNGTGDLSICLPCCV